MAEPVPSLVFESAIVGLAVRLQQTPFAVMATPPSERTVPPLVAVVNEIAEITFVDTDGTPVGTVNVVKEISAPYPVPFELVAYALRWYTVFWLSPVILLE